MTAELLVNVARLETRIALVADGRLREIAFERPGRASLVGNVYRGRVTRVAPGLDAAFVDCGLDRAAFLLARDADPGRPREAAPGAIARLVHEGQAVTVQVTRDPVGDKGAVVTRRLALAGRHLVYAPDGDGVTLSRRLAEAGTRERLERLIAAQARAGEGWIVRTAAVGADADTLRGEIGRLREEWAALSARAESAEPPSLLAPAPDPLLRALRDRAPPGLARIWIDEAGAFGRARGFCERRMPDLAGLLALHADPEPLFDRYGVDSAIEAALEPERALPSGGTIVIEEREALTTIDVNSGPFMGVSQKADTALATNLEAARAIAWEVRLRNIGGMVVIDFIRMAGAAARERVLGALRAALADDPEPVQLGGMSKLGLVDLSRRRSRESLAQALLEPCGVCGGRARVKAARTVMNQILRAMAHAARTARARALAVRAAPEVVTLLESDARTELAEAERLLGAPVRLDAEATWPRDRYELVAR